MSDINYKLVYDLHPYEQAIFAAERARNAAIDKLTVAKQDYEAAIEKALGHKNFRHPHNTACSARGIVNHVFAGGTRDDGVCIYCGAPEWD